jgi:hypothetical protein
VEALDSIPSTSKNENKKGENEKNKKNVRKGMKE